VTVVFGHWSALGLVLRPNLIGLDSGCVWGGKLTAVCLDDRSAAAGTIARNTNARPEKVAPPKFERHHSRLRGNDDCRGPRRRPGSHRAPCASSRRCAPMVSIGARQAIAPGLDRLAAKDGTMLSTNVISPV
jgi:hypothetical protein